VATSKAVEEATGARVHTGTLECVPGLYGAVHVADVLEHSPRPWEILMAVRRLVRPHGIVVARGPLENQANLFQRAVKLSRTIRSRLGALRRTEIAPHHLILFTLDGWHRLIRRTGFSVVEERVYELHWPAPERRFSFKPVSIVKELSMALSRSGAGRRLRLGNRVVSMLRTV